MNTLEKQFCKDNEKQILDKASKFININKEVLKSLGGGFANFIYEYEKNNKLFILRFTLDSYRSFNQVKGEMDFIKYLYKNGVAVAKPIELINNDIVGKFEVEGKSFSVVCFEKLQGIMGVQADWNISLIQNWGKLMGKIHALSKDYIPDNIIKRLEWDKDELAEKIESYIPNYETKVIEKFANIKNTISQLPKDRNSYGMIHGDFTPINFLVDNGEIFVYDFDDCEYNWFVMDIVKALYYSMWRSPETRAVKDNEGYAEYFISNFMTGYEKENVLDSFWLDKIPLFLKFYEIYMYKLAHKEFDIYNLRPEVKEFFRRYKYNIENDIPYIESAYFPWV